MNLIVASYFNPILNPPQKKKTFPKKEEPKVKEVSETSEAKSDKNPNQHIDIEA